MPERESSDRGRLARSGFTDLAAARETLTRLDHDGDEALLASLSATADPDLALAGLGRLVEAAPDRTELHDGLRADEGFRDRLLGVLGASAALADHLARHPDHWTALTDDAIATSRPTRFGLHHALSSAVGERAGRPAYDALRVAYRRA